MSALLVVAGALVGAPLRLWATRVTVRAGRDAALGTLVVNLVGSALLGALTGAAGMPAEALVLVGTGFCGTFTTFSAFGADVLRLAELRRLLTALVYVTATLVLGIAAAVVAWSLALP